MIDPLLLDETSCEEEAAWLASAEALQEEAQAFIRRVTALTRGYVLAQEAGRGDLAVADIMGSFAFDRLSAENCLQEALMFVSHPATLTAVYDGKVGLRHARALMDVIELLPPELADQVEERVLEKLASSPGRPPARVRDLARREALKLDKDAAVRRRREAAKKRHMRVRDVGDGMVEMVLLMRAEHGLQILHRAHQQVEHDDGTDRTRDQRRLDWAVGKMLSPDGPSPADASGAGASTSSTHPEPGNALVPDGRRKRPVQVLVHVPVVTALGLEDEPCELEEIGPIDAEHGRLLLSIAELRKVCVDAVTGQVLHVEDQVVRPAPDPKRVRELGGTAGAQAQAAAEAVRQALLDMVIAPSVMPVDAEPQYRPSAGLARTVRARHQRCDFLTCSTSSHRSDLEHDRPHHRNGETSARNLSPRSRWCHGAKQRGWRAWLLHDGHTMWESLSGRTYPAQPQHEPPPLPRPGAVLPPPAPPPPRDEHGPPDGLPDAFESSDPPTFEPLRGRPERSAPAAEEEPTSADGPRLHRGWPDEPAF